MKCQEIPADVKAEFKSFKRQHSTKSGHHWVESCYRKGLYDGDNNGPSTYGIRLKPREQAEEEREQQEAMKELLSAGTVGLDFTTEPIVSPGNGEDDDDAASDAAATSEEKDDLDPADLDEFLMSTEPEHLDDLEPLPVSLSVMPTAKSTSKRSRPSDDWHQAILTKYSSFGPYRDNDDDASLPSVASSCTGTYSTGATTYYSTSSRYNNASISPTSSRSTSATADLFSSLKMMHGVYNEPGVCNTDLELPPTDDGLESSCPASSSPVPSQAGSSSLSAFPAPPSRQSSPAPVAARSPEPGMCRDEELPPIDEMIEGVHIAPDAAVTMCTGIDGNINTVQANRSRNEPPRKIFPPPVADSIRSTSIGSTSSGPAPNVLIRKVEVAHDLVESALDMRVFGDEPSTQDINRDLAELGKDLYDHFSSHASSDDMTMSIDGNHCERVFSNLMNIGYPTSICGLVASLCFSKQQQNYVRRNKLYSRTFSSVVDVKAELQQMLNHPDLWFYDANIETMESYLSLPTQRKKAKF